VPQRPTSRNLSDTFSPNEPVGEAASRHIGSAKVAEKTRWRCGRTEDDYALGGLLVLDAPTYDFGGDVCRGGCGRRSDERPVCPLLRTKTERGRGAAVVSFSLYVVDDGAEGARNAECVGFRARRSPSTNKPFAKLTCPSPSPPEFSFSSRGASMITSTPSPPPPNPTRKEPVDLLEPPRLSGLRCSRARLGRPRRGSRRCVSFIGPEARRA